MANGANLTVEQFTESVAKQIASELKLDGTDLVNRLVSSLSKGLIEKIAQKQISTPIAQQPSSSDQQQTSKEESKQVEESLKETNSIVKDNLPQLVKGISDLTSQVKQSFYSLSEDFKKSLGATNSIFSGITKSIDKLVDDTSTPQKDDKFPLSIKRHFQTLEKSNKELLKSNERKTEANRFESNLKNFRDAVDTKIKEGLFKLVPKSISSRINAFVEGTLNPKVEKPKEETRPSVVPKAETAQPNVPTKSFLEQTKDILPVSIQGISNEAFDQLSNNLPPILKNAFEGMDKNVEKIVKILEKIPNLLEQIQDAAEEGTGGGILDILPLGRRGATPVRKGTRARNRRANQLRKQRQTQRVSQPGRSVPPPLPKEGPKPPSLPKGAPVGGLGRSVLKRAGVIGAIAGAGLTAAELYDISQAEKKGELSKQEASKMKGGALGGAAGGLGGGLGGAAAGAALGTLIFPGVGTVIGGLAGGILGGMGGESLGRKGGEAIAEATNPSENFEYPKEAPKIATTPEQPPIPAEQIETSQQFTTLQPTEKLPTIESTKQETPEIKPASSTPETPKIDQEAASKAEQQVGLNNKSLDQIASNTSSTNQNIANLVVGFNNLAKALETFGVNVAKQSPTVVNNVVGGSNTQPQVQASQFANIGNPEISNFRTNFVEAARFIPA